MLLLTSTCADISLDIFVHPRFIRKKTERFSFSLDIFLSEEICIGYTLLNEIVIIHTSLLSSSQRRSDKPRRVIGGIEKENNLNYTVFLIYRCSQRYDSLGIVHDMLLFTVKQHTVLLKALTDKGTINMFRLEFKGTKGVLAFSVREMMVLPR